MLSIKNTHTFAYQKRSETGQQNHKETETRQQNAVDNPNSILCASPIHEHCT